MLKRFDRHRYDDLRRLLGGELLTPVRQWQWPQRLAFGRESVDLAFLECGVSAAVATSASQSRTSRLSSAASSGSGCFVCSGLKNDARKYRWNRSILPFVCARYGAHSFTPTP
jgi:hypothetical protein